MTIAVTLVHFVDIYAGKPQDNLFAAISFLGCGFMVGFSLSV